MSYTAAIGQAMIVNGAAVPADNVCVVNMAGFRMDFFFNDLVTGMESHATGGYDIDQTRCMSISDAFGTGITEGDLVMLEVDAYAGETLPGDTAMIYTPGTPTVTFTCTGTTLDYTCALL